MKRALLELVASRLSKFEKIFSALRVDDTIIKIVFEKNEIFYFDLKKGNSLIFKKEDGYAKKKDYKSPFDVWLKSKISGSLIEKVYVLDGNRILVFELLSNQSYKSQKIFFYLEFTGKNTNAIILDENYITIDALRHISHNTSFREVMPQKALIPLPPVQIKEKPLDIVDLDEYLLQEYKNISLNSLLSFKKNKLLSIEKKIDKLNNLLNNLEKPEDLYLKSDEEALKGNLILSNLHNIKNYEKEIEILDFNGENIKIIMPKDRKTPQECANIFFSNAKKLRQKAKNIYIEKENLEQKLFFYKKLILAVMEAPSIDIVNLYFPRLTKDEKKEQNFKPYEIFYFEGYKIIVGRNQKSNIEILNDSKANDIWLHIQGVPSSHVIIKNDKKEVPSNVLEFAAHLCVDFTISTKDRFLVDYTKRKFVKREDGSNVFYTDFKTLVVN